MELSNHISILKRGKRFIIVFTLLITLAAFLFSYLRPVAYSASISFAVKRINKVETIYYDDRYFGIQAADLFSQTVISWFLTPSVLLDIYDRAGIDPQIGSLERFVNRFKTKKYSAQNIVVRFTEKNEETAQTIARTIAEVMEEKAATLNQTADNKAVFEITGEKPVIVKNRTNIALITVIGFVVGLTTSIILVYLYRYFRPPTQSKVNIHSENIS